MTCFISFGEQICLAKETVRTTQNMMVNVRPAQQPAASWELPPTAQHGRRLSARVPQPPLCCRGTAAER